MKSITLIVKIPPPPFGGRGGETKSKYTKIPMSTNTVVSLLFVGINFRGFRDNHKFKDT